MSESTETKSILFTLCRCKTYTQTSMFIHNTFEWYFILASWMSIFDKGRIKFHFFLLNFPFEVIRTFNCVAKKGFFWQTFLLKLLRLFVWKNYESSARYPKSFISYISAVMLNATRPALYRHKKWKNTIQSRELLCSFQFCFHWIMMFL